MDFLMERTEELLEGLLEARTGRGGEGAEEGAGGGGGEAASGDDAAAAAAEPYINRLCKTPTAELSNDEILLNAGGLLRARRLINMATRHAHEIE